MPKVSCNNLERINAHNSFWGFFFGDIFRQIVAYCTNLTKLKIADTKNGGDLLLERESRIKTDT